MCKRKPEGDAIMPPERMRRFLTNRVEDEDVGKPLHLTFCQAADEIERLRAFAAMVEEVTATGDGLDPDGCIRVHLAARQVLNPEHKGEGQDDGE